MIWTFVLDRSISMKVPRFTKSKPTRNHRKLVNKTSVGSKIHPLNLKHRIVRLSHIVFVISFESTSRENFCSFFRTDLTESSFL